MGNILQGGSYLSSTYNTLYPEIPQRPLLTIRRVLPSLAEAYTGRISLCDKHLRGTSAVSIESVAIQVMYYDICETAPKADVAFYLI